MITHKWVEDNPDSSGVAFQDFVPDTTTIIDTVHINTILYPNPTSNLITLDITNKDLTSPTFTHQITDMYGTLKETHTITVPNGTTGHYTYDVSAYTAGVYFHYVLQNSKVYVSDIFIKY